MSVSQSDDRDRQTTAGLSVSAATPPTHVDAWTFDLAPNIRIDASVNALFIQAIAIEGRTAETSDQAQLLADLRYGETLLRRAMSAAPLWIDAARALGRNLWFQSRFTEAKQAFSAAELLRNDIARAAGWPVDACVYLPRNCAEVIGLMGHIDAFVKRKILHADARRYYLLAPSQQIVNRVFLDYWNEYITVVTEPGEIGRLSSEEPAYAVNWNWVMPSSADTIFVHAAIAETQRAWEDAGRAPLLDLRQDHANLLSRARTSWGIGEQERYVCLHVRSEGFYGSSREHAQQFRNTTLDTYYPLIRAVTDMGLWLIRMGDSSTPPLDLAQCGSSGRVVDYAHSPERSAELDVALCARCALFISSPSGLHTVAHAFGRPVCEVNYPIYNGFPWHRSDIFAPQCYFSRDKGRVLTLEEILAGDVVHYDHGFLLERAGITLIGNEPDDIVETVREALDPAAYQVPRAELADRVRAHFTELNRCYNVGISGRIGRYVAAKYAPYLLGTSELTA